MPVKLHFTRTVNIDGNYLSHFFLLVLKILSEYFHLSFLLFIRIKLTIKLLQTEQKGCRLTNGVMTGLEVIIHDHWNHLCRVDVPLFSRIMKLTETFKVAKFKIHRYRSTLVSMCVFVGMCTCTCVYVSNICMILYKMEYFYIKRQWEILPQLKPDSTLWIFLSMILHHSWI